LALPSKRPHRRTSLQRFPALLAVFAILGMFCLSVWHDGMSHAHAPDHATAHAPGHATTLDDGGHRNPAPQRDLADQLHVAAHAVHTIDVPLEPQMEHAAPALALVGTAPKPQASAAVLSDTLLRPPKG